MAIRLPARTRASAVLAVAAAVSLVVGVAASGVTVSTASAASAMRVAAVADSYVDSTAATTNFGTSAQLRIDGSPLVRAHLQFDLRSLSGSVTSATLQLFANSASTMGYDVVTTDGTPWTETGLTFSNEPGLAATPVGSVGPFAARTSTSVDVT